MIRRFFVKTCIIGLLLIYASSAWAWIEVQVTPDPDVLCVCSEEGKVESETAKVTVDVLKPAPDLSGLIPAAGAKVNIVMTHSELSGEVLNEERTAGADGRVVLDYDTGIFNNKPGFVNIIANAEAEMTICGETCETFMTTGTGAAQVTIVKVEIDIAETAAEEDDFVPVGDTQPTKARLLGPEDFSITVTFDIDPADRATILPTSATMKVGTDVDLSITGTQASSSKNDTEVVATVDTLQCGKEDFTVYDIELQIKDYLGRRAIWVDEIDAVAGDSIKFRTIPTPYAVRRYLNYAWDWNELENSDSTDADKDEIDEEDDDTESTRRKQRYEYEIPPYSHLIEEYTVTQNTWVAKAAATDTGKVKIYEGYVTHWLELWGDAQGALLSLKYRVDEDMDITRQSLSENLFRHNLFVYYGHGSQDCFGTAHGSACYWDIRTWRKNHKTPSGKYRRYKFVALTACHCGEKIRRWKSAFDATCIWAWRESVRADHARDFDKLFWEYVLVGYGATGAFGKAEKETRHYYNQYPPGSVAKPVISGHFRFQK